MTDRLEVRLFGGVSFLKNGQPVKSLPTRVSQALLIYLVHKKHPVEREQLIDMFFQASEPKQAAANLRATLSRLRKELSPFLAVTNRTVSIVPQAAIWLDSLEFSQLMASGHGEQALDLYHGEFLAGFFLRDAPEFENWALVERERLRLLAIEAMQKQVSHHQQVADYWAALQDINRLLAVEPLMEAPHRAKMLLLARTGQRPLALQHYKDVSNLFEEELGIAVSAQTTALYERLGNLTTPPPLALPQATDAFIGRTKEIQLLTGLLAEPTRRLINLFGIGGVGKTRLALEVARWLAGENAGMFLDGIYFVPLVGVETAESTALQLMQTIGAPLGGRQSPTEQAIDALRQREMLLIFDNFEQLVGVNGRFLSTILQQAPGIKIITTSRERLNLVEETVFDLSGLPLEAAEPLASEAARLFVSHAQRHQFTFAPGADDAPAIARVCQLLEGIPLGLELAAGLVRQARCSDIVQKIEDNLGDLASPLLNIPERHRSLRAVFLHSWAQLAAELRPIFASLSIFPGAFTAEAALEIAQATVAQLNIFVDKALLKVENGRYAIHPLLREFAAEQIDPATQTSLHNQHASYFAAFIASRSQTYHRPTYLQTLPDLAAAYEDLQLAWRWTIRQLVENESERVWGWMKGLRRPFIRLHYQKSWFYPALTLFREAKQQLEAASWHQPAVPEKYRLLHAQLTVNEWNTARILGHAPEAIAPTQAVIPLLRQHAELDDLFDAYNALAGSYLEMRSFAEIPEILDEMEALASETQKPVMFGVLHVSRSYYTEFMGDAATALNFAEQALKVFQEMEDTFYEAIVWDGIARRLFTLNRTDEAAEALKKAYQLASENDQTLTQAFAQKGLASYYQKKGNLAATEQALAISRQLFTRLDEQRNLVEVDFLQALVAHQRQEWATMTRYLIASLKRAREKQINSYLLNNLVYLPVLHLQRGEPAEAYTVLHFLQTETKLDAAQQAIVQKAAACLPDLSPKEKRDAQETAVTLTLESIADTFLREGLKWFKR